MKLAPRYAALALLLAAFVLPSAASAQQAQKIGSANVQKIFSDIKETKDLETKLKAKGDDLNRKTAELQQKVKALQDSRNQFKPGTDTYDRANQELKRAAQQGQFDLQVTQQDLVGEQKLQTKMIYDKIVAAVSELAKEKGYAVVLAQVIPPEPSDDQFDRLTSEQLINLLRQQNILFVDPSADLTAEVITRLDAKYTTPASNGATAAPAPAKQ